MTSKAALIKALLDGKTVNIKNGFELFSITNVPREIGRSVERSFNVKVDRTPREGISRYKQPCVWVDYKLLKTEENKKGIELMRAYLAEQITEYRPKEKEPEEIKTDLFSELQ